MDALKKFVSAYFELLEETEKMNEEQLEKFSANYPFEKSLEEYVADMIEWERGFPMNEYGYMVLTNKAGHIPVHVVEINSTILASFCAFPNAKSVREYVLSEKERHKRYGINLEWNECFDFSDGLVSAYINGKAFLQDGRLFIANE